MPMAPTSTAWQSSKVCTNWSEQGLRVAVANASSDFATGKPYAMEKPTGQSFVTDQYIVAAHGKAEREWPFIACSEGEFTEVSSPT